MRLLDDDRSFVEWGSQTGDETSTGGPGDGVVAGLGRVHGRSAIVVSYDVTVHGGREGITAQAKVQKAIDVAGQLDAMVFLVAEGGGRRADDPPLYEDRTNQVADLAQLSGRVPLVGIVLGPLYGARALLVSTCDVILATPAALIDLADGPAPVTEPDLDLGLLQQRSGLIDLLLADEDEALEAARSYAQLLAEPLVPYDTPDLPEVTEKLRSVVPENPRRAFDAERVVKLLTDPGSTLLLRPKFGPAMVTALGRIGGRAVGLAANNPMHVAGAIDSPASDKLTRLLRLCNTFGLPIVYLIDTPGLLAGPRAEQSAMARHSTRPYFALHDLRVVIYTVILRRAFGQGAPVMGSPGGARKPVVHLSWPTAQRGGMGLGGAAAISSSSSAAQTFGETRTKEEIERDLVEHGSARSAARRFETDAVIDPGDTRVVLRAAIAHAPIYDVLQPRWPIDAW